MKPALVVLLCATVLFGQKTRFSEHPPKLKPPVAYPLKVHISGIHVRLLCGSGCQAEIYADAVVNGKKIDLAGRYLEFPTGDYQARLRNSESGANPTNLDVKYELLLRDGTVWRCSVAGFSE